MQTNSMDSSAARLPWLDCHANCDVQRVSLQSFPFTIGRVESADLQINSARVSREHAVIVCEGGQYQARDLGSTNGTLHNGEPVREALLAHGDVLTIGDTELTFCDPQQQTAERTATQVMTSRGPTACSAARHEIVESARRMQEVVLHRGFELRPKMLVHLENGAIFGSRMPTMADCYEAPEAGLHGIDLGMDCRLTRRFRQLHRMASAVWFDMQREGEALFLTLDPCELERWEEFECVVRRLTRLISPDKELVLEMPADLVVPSPRQLQLTKSLSDLGVALAYGGCSGNLAEFFKQNKQTPQWIVLSPNLVRDVHRKRHLRRQLESHLDTCRAAGCQVVLDGLESGDDRQICRDIGFDIVQQPLDEAAMLPQPLVCSSAT